MIRREIIDGKAVIANVGITHLLPNLVGQDTIRAGKNEYWFWQAPLNVQVRTLQLKTISFRLMGSVSPDSLKNIKLVIDNVDTGLSSVINKSEGLPELSFYLLKNPIRLKTGTHLFGVKADIVEGTHGDIQIFMDWPIDMTIFDPIVKTDARIDGEFPNRAGTITIKK